KGLATKVVPKGEFHHRMEIAPFTDQNSPIQSWSDFYCQTAVREQGASMRGTGCTSFRSAVSRRSMLTSGAGALSLPVFWQSSTGANENGLKSDTAVIQYWLNGAASHFETFDPKPLAPAHVRGPFDPISTSIPGLQICEALPLHAKLMDQVTL